MRQWTKDLGIRNILWNSTVDSYPAKGEPVLLFCEDSTWLVGILEDEWHHLNIHFKSKTEGPIMERGDAYSGCMIEYWAYIDTN